MISFFLSALIPCLLVVIPGLGIMNWRRTASPLSNWVAILIFSIGSLIITTYIAALVSLPALILITPLCLVSIIIFTRKYQPKSFKPLWLYSGVGVVLYIIFFLPFLIYQHGLPTGDSQKAIIWAEEINRTHQLPNYNQSFVRLNRDAVDFFTPGLHTVTALVQKLTPEPLTAVGFFAILVSLTTATIAAALTRELFPTLPRWVAWLAWLLTLTNFRFLRYLREPGYHYQNIVGELFVWGLLFLLLSLFRRSTVQTYILIIISGIAVLLSHQFSVFLAAFILVPPVILLVARHASRLHTLARKFPHYAIGSIFLALVMIMGVSIAFHLPTKIFHLFASSPHLLDFSPQLIDYFTLLGFLPVTLGVAGLLVLFTRVKNDNEQRYIQWAFGFSVLTLLALTQAPRLGIDIPPVRVLLYLVVPFSVTGSFFAHALVSRLTKKISGPQSPLVVVALATVVVAAMITSVSQAFHLSPTHPTNSTLTPAQQEVVTTIQNHEPALNAAVLTDDSNRRSSSWLVLAGQPTFTRITDMRRQMQEASQSQERYHIYLNQLHFEKIFDLGSRPEIASLLDMYTIRYLTGIAGTSRTNFEHNPLLEPLVKTDEMTLFTVKEPRPSLSDLDNHAAWLTKAATIANDIGDAEDTFLHLPASLRATRLSEPRFQGETTYRVTTAPVITLSFNVGTYTQALWDQDNDQRPDSALELLFLTHQTLNAPLVLVTPTGAQFPVSSPDRVRLPSTVVPIDDRGFIQLTLHNPTGSPLAIDLIALGQSLIP